MELKLTVEQEARLIQLAADEGCSPDELARDVLNRGLDDETRFIEAVKRGIAAADRGEFVAADAVWEGVEHILRS